MPIDLLQIHARSLFWIETMDAIKAGVEKVKEAAHGKKSEDQAAKAHDPSVKPSDRVDAAFESGKAQLKEQEHGLKADHHQNKHAHS